jgi:hypothetical protein
MAQIIFEDALVGDLNNDDFIASKVPTLVKEAVAAEPGFQSCAVFSLSLYFDRLDLLRLEDSARKWRSLAEIEDDLRRTVRRQFLFTLHADSFTGDATLPQLLI